MCRKFDESNPCVNPEDISSIQDIERANERAGYYWFSPDTMRFFRSRVGYMVYKGPGGIFFVSSEQYTSWDHTESRYYTVRGFNPVTGAIYNGSEFQAFSSHSGAVKYAIKLAAGLAAPAENPNNP